jgi:succinate-semialdehyde dehydrogenase/glutarate-semialdehyde dehydrogenase
LLVTDAVANGATVLSGGYPLEGLGNFYEPTVLTNVDMEARIARTEIFGPVVTITPFDDEDDAISKANATEYGLVAYA